MKKGKKLQHSRVELSMDLNGTENRGKGNEPFPRAAKVSRPKWRKKEKKSAFISFSWGIFALYSVYYIQYTRSFGTQAQLCQL